MGADGGVFTSNKRARILWNCHYIAKEFDTPPRISLVRCVAFQLNGSRSRSRASLEWKDRTGKERTGKKRKQNKGKPF